MKKDLCSRSSKELRITNSWIGIWLLIYKVQSYETTLLDPKKKPLGLKESNDDGEDKKSLSINKKKDPGFIEIFWPVG